MTTVRNQNMDSETHRQDTKTAEVAPARKTFVEPTISRPVDVLEATTFFQAVDSGGTVRRRSGE
jgi:hypothetical protein